MRKWLLPTVALWLGLMAGFCGGCMYEYKAVYRERYLEERDLVVPILESDASFSRVEVIERSSGGVDLAGTVPTDAALNSLRQKVLQAMGERRSNKVLYDVRVKAAD